MATDTCLQLVLFCFVFLLRIRVFFWAIHGFSCVYSQFFAPASTFTALCFAYSQFFTGISIFPCESRTAGNLSPLFPLKQCPDIHGFDIRCIFQEGIPLKCRCLTVLPTHGTPLSHPESKVDLIDALFGSLLLKLFQVLLF